MEKARQLEIAHEILNNIKTDVLHAVREMPEDFNGYEIRQVFIDYVNAQYGDHLKNPMSQWKYKKRAYNAWKIKLNEIAQNLKSRYWI